MELSGNVQPRGCKQIGTTVQLAVAALYLEASIRKRIVAIFLKYYSLIRDLMPSHQWVSLSLLSLSDAPHF